MIPTAEPPPQMRGCPTDTKGVTAVALASWVIPTHPTLVSLVPLAAIGRCESCRQPERALIELLWSDGARFEVCDGCAP